MQPQTPAQLRPVAGKYAGLERKRERDRHWEKQKMSIYALWERERQTDRQADRDGQNNSDRVTDCCVIFCVFSYHLANNQAINHLLPLPPAYFFILLLFFSFSTLSLTNVYHTGIQYTRNAKVSSPFCCWFVCFTSSCLWRGPGGDQKCCRKRGYCHYHQNYFSKWDYPPWNNSHKNHTSNN